MTNRANRIKVYLEEKGYVMLDWQMNDPSVGIPQGYVVIQDMLKVLHEIAWDDAEYHALHKTSKKIMKKDIKPYKE